jgi:hypothetical protein
MRGLTSGGWPSGEQSTIPNAVAGPSDVVAQLLKSWPAEKAGDGNDANDAGPVRSPAPPAPIRAPASLCHFIAQQPAKTSRRMRQLSGTLRGTGFQRRKLPKRFKSTIRLRQRPRTWAGAQVQPHPRANARRVHEADPLAVRQRPDSIVFPLDAGSEQSDGGVEAHLRGCPPRIVRSVRPEPMIASIVNI